jgi:hypothetical protein
VRYLGTALGVSCKWKVRISRRGCNTERFLARNVPGAVCGAGSLGRCELVWSEKCFKTVDSRCGLLVLC